MSVPAYYLLPLQYYTTVSCPECQWCPLKRFFLKKQYQNCSRNTKPNHLFVIQFNLPPVEIREPLFDELFLNFQRVP